MKLAINQSKQWNSQHEEPSLTSKLSQLELEQGNGEPSKEPGKKTESKGSKSDQAQNDSNMKKQRSSDCQKHNIFDEILKMDSLIPLCFLNTELLPDIPKKSPEQQKVLESSDFGKRSREYNRDANFKVKKNFASLVEKHPKADCRKRSYRKREEHKGCRNFREAGLKGLKVSKFRNEKKSKFKPRNGRKNDYRMRRNRHRRDDRTPRRDQYEECLPKGFTECPNAPENTTGYIIKERLSHLQHLRLDPVLSCQNCSFSEKPEDGQEDAALGTMQGKPLKLIRILHRKISNFLTSLLGIRTFLDVYYFLFLALQSIYTIMKFSFWIHRLTTISLVAVSTY